MLKSEKGTRASLERLCILTPVRVTSAERYDLSAASLKSLHDQIGTLGVSNFVVQDVPSWGKAIPGFLASSFPALAWSERARKLYEVHDASCLEGLGKGSASALLVAVNAAIAAGKSFGFIHLDDHVYCDPFAELIAAGLQAMQGDENLIWTRFSGYPIMYDARTSFAPQEDRIIFDKVALSPLRTPGYTLWHAPITAEANEGRYWPVALWFCIFRLEALRELLQWPLEKGVKHLAHVEEYYKEGKGYQRLMARHPLGRFGYINMQFGGFEMHRNPNWQELISGENEAVR